MGFPVLLLVSARLGAADVDPHLDRLPEHPRWRVRPTPWHSASFIFFFALVTVMGFVAAKWEAAGNPSPSIDEWGLGGRQFGTWITWFLIGGDFYTAYTVIAVPAVVYGIGAYGFFALPYTIIVYPFVFAVMPILWKVAKDKNYVTAGDVVYGRYGSRTLEAAVAATGVLATMPYIALQLVGMAAVIKALGLTGEVPARHRLPDPRTLHLLVRIAGTRADRLRQGHHDLHRRHCGGGLSADETRRLRRDLHGRRRGSRQEGRGVRRQACCWSDPGARPSACRMPLWPWGSALAAFMYPHTLTGVFASASAQTLRKNAVLLPAYTLLLGLLALLGYMGLAAHLELKSNTDIVPGAVPDILPAMVRRLRLRRRGDRRPSAGCRHVDRRGEPVHAEFLEGLRQSQPCNTGGRGEGGQTDLARRQGRRAGLHHRPADAVRARSAAAWRHVDPADLSGGGLRAVHRLVQSAGGSCCSAGLPVSSPGPPSSISTA